MISMYIFSADPIPPPENVDGTCPEGWVEYDEGAHCYRFMGTLVGEWMTAYSACQQYDARLPIINKYAHQLLYNINKG